MANAPSIEAAVQGREWIICPAPGLGERDQIYAPNATSSMFLEESLLALSHARRGGLILGKESSTLADVAERLQIPIHEFKADRALAVVVASAVAEAVLAELIGSTSRVLRELRVIVLGYGATGSAIADVLVAVGCGTSVASRNQIELETARRRGATPLEFASWPDAVGPADVLVNTVPDPQTIGPALFETLSGKTIIDISSPPGGLDHQSAQSAGINVIWARGLAGKRAPLTIGEAQFEFIKRAMANGGQLTDGEQT